MVRSDERRWAKVRRGASRNARATSASAVVALASLSGLGGLMAGCYGGAGSAPETDGGVPSSGGGGGPGQGTPGGGAGGPSPGVDGGGSGNGGTGNGGIAGGHAGPGSRLAGCEIFPNDHPWNVSVDGASVQVVHTYDSQLVPGRSLHPDFGDYTKNHYGIPYNVVEAQETDEPIRFTLYANQSDPGPGGWVGVNPVTTDSSNGLTAMPFFTTMKIEGDPAGGGQPGSLDGDQHGIVLRKGTAGCTSYEAWNCTGPTESPFVCANGAVFNLTSNKSRPAGWTSGDLAGLSILAGLVKVSEVKAGVITHALRVTFNRTQSGYIPPATHAVTPGQAPGALGSAYPPMGLRLRLKSSVPISHYSAPSQVILTAMKTYGLMVADIGSDWYFQGDSDDQWLDQAPDGQDSLIGEIVSDFSQVKGSDFEAVFTGAPVSAGL